MLKTTDNNYGSLKVETHFLPDLQIIANTKIENLIVDDNHNLLVFPHNLNQYGDEIGEEHIFTLNESKLTTGNIMGFIGVNGREITIQSRFARDDNDYFLHYMLQKVFSINLFDLKHGTNTESIFDFLLYLFPFYLKKAIRQGLYKEYHKQNYNDANVRGTIDFNRHLRQNIPFIGKVAYRVREHSYDNRITQLIRHTIEFIRKHKLAQGILNIDTEIQNCVMQIIQATSSYEYRQRNSIINNNIKPFFHSYFSEYKELQKICLQILKYEGLKYGEEKDKVYGLLFDGAWLWEEYLNTFLRKCGFNHPKNKSSEGAIYLFSNSNSKYKRYPDFWKENFIIDAKYKRMTGTIDRDDMNQIISYMYVKEAKVGGFIVPSETRTEEKCLGLLNGYGGEVNIWTLPIPQKNENFIDFCNLMKKNENTLIALVKSMENKKLDETGNSNHKLEVKTSEFN